MGVPMHAVGDRDLVKHNQLVTPARPASACVYHVDLFYLPSEFRNTWATLQYVWSEPSCFTHIIPTCGGNWCC